MFVLASKHSGTRLRLSFQAHAQNVAVVRVFTICSQPVHHLLTNGAYIMVKLRGSAFE